MISGNPTGFFSHLTMENVKHRGSEIEIFNKITSLMIKTIKCLQLDKSSPACALVKNQLKNYRHLTRAIKVFYEVPSFRFRLDPEASWEKVIGKGFSLLSKCLTFISFLDDFQIIKFGSLAASTGIFSVYNISQVALISIKGVKKGFELFKNGSSFNAEYARFRESLKNASANSLESYIKNPSLLILFQRALRITAIVISTGVFVLGVNLHAINIIILFCSLCSTLIGVYNCYSSPSKSAFVCLPDKNNCDKISNDPNLSPMKNMPVSIL